MFIDLEICALSSSINIKPLVSFLLVTANSVNNAAGLYVSSIPPWIDRKRIQVSSIESKENLVFENLANPSLYSHAHMGAYCQEKNILC